MLRCGLTTKSVDPTEVLRVLDDTPLVDPLVRPVAATDGGIVYPVPVDDFALHRAVTSTSTKCL